MENNENLEIDEEIIEWESEEDFKKMYQELENEDDIDIYTEVPSDEIWRTHRKNSWYILWSY